MNKQKLGVSLTSAGINIYEHVKNGKRPYEAVLADNLSPKQAIALALQLIKAAQS